MKKIEAIIQPDRLDHVKEALAEVGVTRLTVSNVQGFGRQKGRIEIFGGEESELFLLPKIKLEIVVNDSFLERAIESILSSASTGKIGDGKIFVLPLEECVRIRSQERGSTAI